MDDRQLRELFGTLAGALIGFQLPRDGKARKAASTLAGGIVGRFTADLVNALGDIAEGRGSGTLKMENVISERLYAVEDQAFMRGMLLAIVVMPIFERIRNTATSSATIEDFFREHWGGIETECKAQARSVYATFLNVCMANGFSTANFEFDLEADIDRMSRGFKVMYDI